MPEPLAENAATSRRTTGRQKRRGFRLTNRQLVLGILLVVIVWLVFLATALLLGIIAPKAPRTALERSLRVYETAVDEGTSDPAVWSAYISAMIDAGQYARAERLVEDGLQAVADVQSPILYQKTRLLFAEGHYEESVSAADAALSQLDAEYKATKERYETLGVTIEPEYGESWGPTLIVKAQALDELGKVQEAIDVLDLYLEVYVTASDVFVLRGDLKAELDDTTGAEADYREALKYVPDYDLALEGLQRIGAGD